MGGRLLGLMVVLAWPYCHPERSEGSVSACSHIRRRDLARRDDRRLGMTGELGMTPAPIGPAWRWTSTPRPTSSGATPSRTPSTSRRCSPASRARCWSVPAAPHSAPRKAPPPCAKPSRRCGRDGRCSRCAGRRDSPGAAADHVKRSGTDRRPGASRHRRQQPRASRGASRPLGHRHGREHRVRRQPGRQVVIQLLVDDGVPDRGHRDNILDGRWGAEGAACGPHRDYRQICVMDYAVRYVER